VYNGHPWDSKKVAVVQRLRQSGCCSQLIPIKLLSVLGNWSSSWPLWTGGRCPEVVVNTGLTVLYICLFSPFKLMILFLYFFVGGEKAFRGLESTFARRKVKGQLSRDRVGGGEQTIVGHGGRTGKIAASSKTNLH
jgi:hypothetical protein